MIDQDLKKKIIKWIWYSLFLFLMYILQCVPQLFEIMGAKPGLILPAAVGIGVVEGEISAAWVGGIMGLCWDVSSCRLSGLHAITMCVGCVAVCLLCKAILRPTLVNLSMVSAVMMLAITMFDYLLSFFFYYENSFYLLQQQMIPSVVYTALVSPFILYCIKRMAPKEQFL